MFAARRALAFTGGSGKLRGPRGMQPLPSLHEEKENGRPKPGKIKAPSAVLPLALALSDFGQSTRQETGCPPFTQSVIFAGQGKQHHGHSGGEADESHDSRATIVTMTSHDTGEHGNHRANASKLCNQPLLSAERFTANTNGIVPAEYSHQFAKRRIFMRLP